MVTINRILIALTIIIGLTSLYVGFSEPVAQIYNPTQTAELQNIQSSFAADLKDEEKIIIEVPKKVPEEENKPTEVSNEIPQPKPEVFGFLDIIANTFNQPILAGYYLNNCANAQRAAELIHDTIIQPGEMFSFNKVVGPRTVSRGFTEGRIIVNNQYRKGVGGGICRTSTALYQVAKQAGLQINEVHRHSLPIGYAKPNQDAAVWYNTQDLKITNTKEYPVKILTYTDKKLYIAIVRDLTSEEMHEEDSES